MKRSKLLWLFLIACLLPVTACAAYERGIVQDTPLGKVKGAELDGALVWLGIPYGAAPVGELRWKAPQPVTPWKDTFEAKESFAASQMSGGKLIGSEEGALTLDVTRPDTDETGLPVFFYIHGGNNQTGRSSAFPAQNFVKETNSVVVSVNHRLGLQGSIALPALKHGTPEENSGNFVLLDLAAALDWVAANIESFGGDPKNITITGSSAGGRNVMAMLISPVLKGKFHKAISYSGGMTTADVKGSQRLEARALARFAVEAGVQPDAKAAEEWLQQDNEEVRKFLFSLSDEALASAFGGAGIRMSLFPHHFADGVSLPVEGYATKNWNDVPVMMVTGDSEFSLFCWQTEPFAKLKAPEIMANPEILAQYKFAETYGSLMYGYFNAEESAEKMFAAGYKSPIYTCVIRWGDDPTVVGQECATIVGSYHCMTTPFMTGILAGLSSGYPEQYAQAGSKAAAAMLNQYYANFMHSPTGDPNGDGLTKWEPWTSLNGTTQLIVDGDLKNAWAYMTTQHTSYQEILERMDADTTLTPEQKELMNHTVINDRWFSDAHNAHYNVKDAWE